MIIVVDEHLIETDYIYNITPIIDSNPFGDTSKPAFKYSFTINFLNSKSIDIIHSFEIRSLYLQDVNSLKIWNESLEKKRQITAVRDELIKIVSKSESDIPRLLFENY